MSTMYESWLFIVRAKLISAGSCLHRGWKGHWGQYQGPAGICNHAELVLDGRCNPINLYPLKSGQKGIGNKRMACWHWIGHFLPRERHFMHCCKQNWHKFSRANICLKKMMVILFSCQSSSIPTLAIHSFIHDSLFSAIDEAMSAYLVR